MDGEIKSQLDLVLYFGEHHLAPPSLGNTTHWITPERPLGYYLFEIYTPSVFIVIMSWFNFWLNR